MRAVFRFFDALWRWPSHKVGRLLWWLTGMSTAMIGFFLFAAGAMLIVIEDALKHEWMWMTIQAAISVWIILVWQSDFSAMHDAGDREVLPVEYHKLWALRIIMNPIAITGVVVGVWWGEWYAWIDDTLYIMGIHIGTMLWPKQKSAVRRAVEALRPAPAVVPETG